MAEADSDKWRNRIVGYDTVDPKTLKANPSNWRVHPLFQRQALAGALKEVGWVQDIIVNRRTGYVLDGHLRIMLAKQNGEEAVPVKYVDLSENEERLVLATLDPIGALAEAEAQIMGDLLRQIETEDAALRQLVEAEAAQLKASQEGDGGDGGALPDGEEGGEAFHTMRTQSPVYEPRGEKPSVAELYDPTKTEQLVEEIQNAKGLPDEVRAFLIAAAQRHTVFYFDKIAEFYAHAPVDVQDLMERSALVIVDFDRAIELGFVRLTNRLLEQVRDEYGD